MKHPLFQKHFAACPLISVIRGVTPDEVEAIAEAIYEAGIRIIEVPMNSPEPLKSIGKLAKLMGDRALVGAGTVLAPGEVTDVRSAGGQIIVSPNTNTDVIAATVAAGMVSCPGVFTPTEAFAAIAAGAHALKLFPAEGATPAFLKAQRAVLPKDVPVLVVGGIKPDPELMASWIAAGADGFGLGSGVFKPGNNAAQVLENARAYVAALRR
jgi:2-dehydro-3-deoxyphosphogalactonate aldolase